MKSLFLTTVLALLTIASIHQSASAQVVPTLPDPAQSTATGPASPVTILISPAIGFGDRLDDRGATVTVTVLDANADPLVGYPAQDIWLDDVGNGDLSMCPGGAIADGPTNANGVTRFTGRLRGGGHTQSGLQVYLSGQPLQAAPLAIDVVSPDIDGDTYVGLPDVVAFSNDFAGGVATFRSDLTHDGALNLADVSRLALHLGDQCGP